MLNDKRYLKRLQERMHRVMCQNARENVVVRLVDDDWFVYGSEIAVLRLYRHYMKMGLWCDMGYSPNLDTYWFKIARIHVTQD